MDVARQLERSLPRESGEIRSSKSEIRLLKEIRIPKSEFRNKFEARNPKSETSLFFAPLGAPRASALGVALNGIVSNFGFWISGLFRISSFGFRTSLGGAWPLLFAP